MGSANSGVVVITIYGELYSKKNSKRVFCRGGRTIVIPSEAYAKSEKDLLIQLQANRSKFIEMIKDKKKPLIIGFKIYRKTKRKFDFNNISQGILDCMVKVRMIPDDNADEIIPLFVPYSIDKDNPRVEIFVR